MATEAERNRGAGAYSTPGVDVPQPGQHSFTGAKTSPEVLFKFHDVDPPSTLYVTENDQVVIIIKSSVTDSVNVRTRILRKDGTQQFQQEIFQVTNSRLGQQFGFNLTEGYLLGVQVSHPNPTIAAGQIYVQGWFSHQGIFSGFSTQPLFAGYVRFNTSVGWPGVNVATGIDGLGFLRTIVGTTPAAGAEISEVVPTGARWRLQSFRTAITTSAAVANRQPSLILDDGLGNVWFSQDANAQQAASLTVSYTWAPGCNSITGSAGRQDMPVPSPTYLFAGWRIRTLTANIQAADQWGPPIYSVEEWIEN